MFTYLYFSENYGRVLVLDGCIQLTERDECHYQEMITHIPLNAHPNPRRVLIIGGGDGGCAREAANHPSVEHVDLVEIDAVVLKAARDFLPFTSVGFDHPKVTVHTADGFQFLKDRVANGEKYDVIITDSTDPGGTPSCLFKSQFGISDSLYVCISKTQKTSQ